MYQYVIIDDYIVLVFASLFCKICFIRGWLTTDLSLLFNESYLGKGLQTNPNYKAHKLKLNNQNIYLNVNNMIK